MKTILSVFAMFFVFTQVKAQNIEFEATSSSKLSVSGTSSLHDWECKVENQNGSLTAVIENGKITAIKDFRFQFKAKALKSGKGGMDKKMYTALKEEDYPEISYRYDAVQIDGNWAVFIGQMSLAGVTKRIKTPVKVSFKNGELTLDGEKSFDLSTFDIDPPKAIFGTIKTGEEVTIHYHMVLQQK